MEVTQGAPFESFGLSEATMRAIRNKHYTVSTRAMSFFIFIFISSFCFEPLRLIAVLLYYTEQGSKSHKTQPF